MRSGGGGTILQRGLRQGPKWFAEQIRQGDIRCFAERTVSRERAGKAVLRFMSK